LIGWLRQGLDALRGRGEAAPTVPPMDGALRPNVLLESAPVIVKIAAPDNLVRTSRSILFSSASSLLALDPDLGRPEELRRFECPIASLAAHGDLVAVALTDGSLRLIQEDRKIITFAGDGGQRPACPTAMTFRDASTLIVCQGSARNAPEKWKYDLMQRERSGSLWQIGLSDGAAQKLVGNMGFPNGVVVEGEDLVVSESWRHRLLKISGRDANPLLSDLPGYTSRVVPGAGGGYWLCVFAPRSQLIELVLIEKDFRERMLRELAPEHWVAPTLAPARSFLEPMQGGALRTHGIIKPWSPTRSCGLLVKLDGRFRPVASFHSRADGQHHGVTSCLDLGDQILVASQGGDAILSLRPATGATQ
jgi:hypothetical protein